MQRALTYFTTGKVRRYSHYFLNTGIHAPIEELLSETRQGSFMTFLIADVDELIK